MTHLPGRKEEYHERLHKLDMKNLRFCELSTFGSALVNKEVRERAIADRVSYIE